MRLHFAVVMLICVQSAVHAQVADKPNIILIMADDLGYGDLGCYGQSKIKTPNIDQLADEGVRFTQHYAGSTVCGPSRASLLTGLHTGHSPVRGNPRWTASGEPVDMPREQITVAEELKRAGYVNGIVGKWGMAEADLESMPLNQGFDYFYGFRKHVSAHHYYPDILWENNEPFHPEGNVASQKVRQYSHDSLTSKALEFVKTNADTTFFLYLAFTIPHYELTVPPDSKEPYLNLGWEDRTVLSDHYFHDKDAHVTYAGMISRMDRDVGRLLALLRQLGIDENTIVIFTSDNGHEYDNRFFDSNGPLKGKKRDLYEGGIRIPFIARWPGKIEPGTHSSHISAFWDFLPTACEMAGIQPSTYTDGISYLPSLVGGYQVQHDYLYWEFNEWQGPIQAVRQDDWKAVKFFDKPLELYNLAEDISESDNLAAEHTQIALGLEAIINQARTENPNFPLKPHPRIQEK